MRMDFVLISFIKPDKLKTLKIDFSGYEIITTSLNYNFTLKVATLIYAINNISKIGLISSINSAMDQQSRSCMQLHNNKLHANGGKLGGFDYALFFTVRSRYNPKRLSFLISSIYTVKIKCSQNHLER